MFLAGGKADLCSMAERAEGSLYRPWNMEDGSVRPHIVCIALNAHTAAKQVRQICSASSDKTLVRTHVPCTVTTFAMQEIKVKYRFNFLALSSKPLDKTFQHFGPKINPFKTVTTELS
jgi:hypothetical protein